MLTTFMRPENALCIIRDIADSVKGRQVLLIVHNDKSSSDYRSVKEFIRKSVRYFVWIEPEMWRGKVKFWETTNNLLREAQKVTSHFFYMVQDDARLCRNFFDRAESAWNKIDAPDKIALDFAPYNFKVFRRDLWNRKAPEFHSFPCETFIKLGWIDCWWMATNKMLQALDYRILPIPSMRWARRKGLSSGVGQQLSQRLYHIGSLWSVSKSLVDHSVTIHSLMNGGDEKKRELYGGIGAYNFIDRKGVRP
jgi:hypothetical protein